MSGDGKVRALSYGVARGPARRPGLSEHFICVLAPLRETLFPHPLREIVRRIRPARPATHAARVYNREFKGKLPEIGCRHTRSGMVCPGASRSLLYFQPLGMVG